LPHLKRLMWFINKTSARRILFLCHQNADPDALCSAYVVAKVLNRIDPRLRIGIGAAGGASKISKRIIGEIPIRFDDLQHLDKMDLFVLFDTNTVQQLGELGKRILGTKKPIAIIDHHAASPTMRGVAQLRIVDEKSRSTCELVYNLIEKDGIVLSKKEALCLFTGMAYDTRHFAIASAESFRVAAKLVDVGVDPEKVMKTLSMPLERSERIARLKAAQRIKIIDFKNWIVVFSRVSSHQASSARGLLSLGADVAVVGGESDSSIRASIRASGDFLDGTGIHIGRDLAQPLGESIGGAGGGHRGAAGINGGKNLERFFTECKRILAKKLNQ
jgi:phosphoesterase RecJ-like protein